ncbi:MAG: hypothetical protein R3F65_26040 [bacterium]
MRLVTLALALALAAPALAKKPPEVDHLGLATMLLRDGHPDRAGQALDAYAAERIAGADPKAEDGPDRPRYHTLRGVIALRQRDFTAALAAFDAAIAAGATDAALHLYRARSAWALDDCATVLAAFAAAGPLADGEADFFAMRSACHGRAGRHAAALAALDAGEAAFPDRRDLGRLRVEHLLALGLHQAAVDAGRRYIAGGGGLDDHLFVSEALLQAGQAEDARLLLEEARLRFGDDERLLVQLGHAWLGTDHPLVAARMFEAAALFDPKYARDAAELYREQQAYGRALALNGRLLEQPAKLRQRMALLLDMERFEAVVALTPRLARLGMLAEDEELRYALAYAHFRLGDFGEAEAQLRRLTKPALFERAGQLRKAMADCRAGGECD